MVNNKINSNSSMVNDPSGKTEILTAQKRKKEKKKFYSVNMTELSKQSQFITLGAETLYC